MEGEGYECQFTFGTVRESIDKDNSSECSSYASEISGGDVGDELYANSRKCERKSTPKCHAKSPPRENNGKIVERQTRESKLRSHQKLLLRKYVQDLKRDKIQTLSIRGVFLDDESVVDISDAVRGNTSVRSLFLRSCEAESVEGWKYFGKALASCPSLTHVTVEGDGETCSEEKERKAVKSTGACLAEILRSSLSIESLSLQDCYISDIGFQLMGQALTSSKLKEFHWLEGNNKIGKDFFLGLKNNSCLNKIVLENCDFTPDCLRDMRMGLSSNKALRHLSLHECWMTPEGADHFGNGLAKNQTLERLQLNSCPLQDDEVVAVFHALQKEKFQSKITELEITGYFAGAKGMEAITEAVIYTPSLQKLSLTNCDLSMETRSVLISSFSLSNNHLKELVLTGTTLSKEDLYNLREFLLLNNRSLLHFPFGDINLVKQKGIDSYINMSTAQIQNDIQQYLHRNELLRYGEKMLKEEGCKFLIKEKREGTGHGHTLVWTDDAWDFVKLDAGAALIHHALSCMTPGSVEDLFSFCGSKQKDPSASFDSQDMTDLLCDLVENNTDFDGLNMLQWAVQGTSRECLDFAKYLVDSLGADVDHLPFRGSDESARELALSNEVLCPELNTWANFSGLIMNRYDFQVKNQCGQKTSPYIVQYSNRNYIAYHATDRFLQGSSEPQKVLLHLYLDQNSFERECQMRLWKASTSTKKIEPSDLRFDEKIMEPIFSVHYSPDEVRSFELVLRRSRRSKFFTGIPASIAGCIVAPPRGRDLETILSCDDTSRLNMLDICDIVKDIARCIHALHIHPDGPFIHGSLTPKEIVRYYGGYRLLGMGALSGLSSLAQLTLDEIDISCYTAPEIVKVLSSVVEGTLGKDGEGQLDRQMLALEKAISEANDDYVRDVLKSQYDSLKIRLTEFYSRSCPKDSILAETLDVWSLGMITCRMLVGERSFHYTANCSVGSDESEWTSPSNQFRLTEKNLNLVLNRKSFPFNTCIENNAAVSFLQACLAPNPVDRFQSMNDVLNHPFLKGGNEGADQRLKTNLMLKQKSPTSVARLGGLERAR